MASWYFDEHFGNWLPDDRVRTPRKDDWYDEPRQIDYCDLKIDVDVSKLTEDEAVTVLNKLWDISYRDEYEENYFKVDEDCEENDEENFRKIELLGWCPEGVLYSVCDYLNTVENVGYEEVC